MSRSHRHWVVVLVSGLLLPGAVAAAGDGPQGAARRVDERAARPAATARPAGAREALAASIPRRELALAQRRREEVLAEVEARARALGVAASAAELTDLLWQRASLEIALDTCRLAGGAGCAALERSLADVEARFHGRAGITTREFRRGRLDLDGGAGPRATAAASRAGGGPRGIFAASNWDPEHCVCGFTVYSSNRWMNPYWGLECNNHGSHGVCSNNVDSAHSPGSGAMTGEIDLFFGQYWAARECPDDHYTCFRGPSTDHTGAWGNTCSCDTWHSQYSNPWISWYGGSLADALEVGQLSTWGLIADGPCNGNGVTIKEFIEENDPWCCDDPMGDLWISLPIQDGSGSSSGQTSAQNCNGGSQSGVYPNCGTFGATIRVAYSCETRPDAPDGSCWGWCFDDPPDASCSCQVGCYSQGTCCSDYQTVCCDQYPQWNGCLQ